MQNNKPLYVYTITDHPSDFPEHYAVRRQAIMSSSPQPVIDPNFLMLSKDLEELRRTLMMDMHLVCLGREDEDDKVIVESWI